MHSRSIFLGQVMLIWMLFRNPNHKVFIMGRKTRTMQVIMALALTNLWEGVPEIAVIYVIIQ